MPGTDGAATLKRSPCWRPALFIACAPLAVALLAQGLYSALIWQFACGSGGEFTARCNSGVVEAIANVETVFGTVLFLCAVPLAILIFAACRIRRWRATAPLQSSDTK